MTDLTRIHILDPIVAQRIAAGEVIERPASVVRELLDNSIDAGAGSITVQVVNGGLDRITVIDDGYGIAAEDLPLCCKPHATSKIAAIEDLYHVKTLGFRGEALYSIAATSKLTIASTRAGQSGHTVTVDNGTEGIILPFGPDKGTRIDVEHLFADLPARRLFLKRPSTETTMCKAVVLEKAMAFPDIAFRFHDGDVLKVDLPATSRKQRVLDALAGDPNVIPAETVELSEQAGKFCLYAVASTPAYWRTDRSHIKIYVNNRAIDEFALVQAVTYGYGSMLPGGAYPYCYLFIDIDPELVDFNIHPAKREAKIRNKAEVHHAVVQMIKRHISQTLAHIPIAMVQPTDRQFDFSGERQEKYVKSGRTAQSGLPQAVVDSPAAEPDWFDTAKRLMHRNRSGSPAQDIAAVQKGPRYIGQIFNLFLIAEQDDDLYLIDQHAAHERILFDEIKSHGEIQPLMIPITFEVERDVDVFLTAHAAWYGDYGLSLRRTGDLEWELSSIPALWKPIEQDVVRFIGSRTGAIEDLYTELYAVIACHAAIKAGDRIDRLAAQTLVEKVLAMDNPVCPHGRMFVIHFQKDELLTAVGRII